MSSLLLLDMPFRLGDTPEHTEFQEFLRATTWKIHEAALSFSKYFEILLSVLLIPQ